ncbi:hypothetical protein [Aphanothece microscopica]|uniref:hypothetical protein n=1 Tax=Aphanothece microscopica TaxID=1049561 RepID=UPI00398485F2
MKFIYIVGLEHSGTTLTNHLLSAHPKVLGLGEVSQFFSPGHMNNYVAQWGGYQGATLCSCLEDWNQCEFWRNMIDLCGLNSNIPLVSKYKSLVTYVRATQGEDAIIVDSSKVVATLQMLSENFSEIFMPHDVLRVIFSIKDVRSFSASMVSRPRGKRSLISVWRAFNYWLGANKIILRYLVSGRVDFRFSLYESLCFSPSDFLNEQLSALGLRQEEGELSISRSSSHIAMGNKNFLMRNRARIRYDSRWLCDDLINLVYLAHFRARAFNSYIHSSMSLANSRA